MTLYEIIDELTTVSIKEGEGCNFSLNLSEVREHLPEELKGVSDMEILDVYVRYMRDNEIPMSNVHFTF